VWKVIDDLVPVFSTIAKAINISPQTWKKKEVKKRTVLYFQENGFFEAER
jgi:hypothetical protein